MLIRRHGWQRPLHSLQIIGMVLYCFLIAIFYAFLVLFLGNRNAEITVVVVFSVLAAAVMFLFVRCTAIDPSDNTRFVKKGKSKSDGNKKLDYRFIVGQIVRSYFNRMERKILRTFIRRKYLDSWTSSSAQVEPLLPFPLIIRGDTLAPAPKGQDVLFCSLCNYEVRKVSKHCRSCNRCVEGFDHHCRWLNNCIGKKNYTSFFLLMISVLLMLVLEGGAAAAVFIRCLTDKKGIEDELKKKLNIVLPMEVLATLSAFMVVISGYSTAAIGQLFLFHVVLIKKGMRTYDYIMAMREKHVAEFEAFDDSDLSSECSTDSSDSPPEKTKFTIDTEPRMLSVRVEGGSGGRKSEFRAGINPWELIKMSREKAGESALKQKQAAIAGEEEDEHHWIKPLPLETPTGFKTGHLSSPRRRFSSSGKKKEASPRQKNQSVDSGFVEMASGLESYILKHEVLCSSVFNQDSTEASPRRR